MWQPGICYSTRLNSAGGGSLPMRRAVAPIIATLLLIAIAVAAGVIVYTFVNSMSGELTQDSESHVAEELSMDAYSYSSANPTFVLRNIGSVSLVISAVYFDGNLCQASGLVCTTGPLFTFGTCSPVANCAPQQYVGVQLSVSPQPALGTSHTLRVVSVDGGTFTFAVVAGRSG